MSQMPLDQTIPGPKDKLRIAGGILYLCARAPLQRRYSVELLIDRIFPALELGQFRFFEQDDGQPRAFICWAFASEETTRRLGTGEPLDGIQDWYGGDQLVFVELLAPFGDVRAVRKDLADNVFPNGTQGISFRPKHDQSGKLTSVRKLHYTFNKSKAAETGLTQGE